MDYTAKDIKILEGLEAVRKRPAMYIGDTGKRGLNHLVFEILDNSIDEALAGHAKHIVVKLNKDGSVEIKDDGRGIPTEMHDSGKSALEVVTTVLHAGGKFEKKAYQVSGGLHGVGISVVNALSEWMEVEVHRNGKIYYQKYERGKPVTDVKIIGECKDTGTIVRFKPDKEIFSDINFDPEILRDRIRELAFLNKGIEITFINEKTGEKEKFYYEGGIKEFVEYLTKVKKPISSVIYFDKTINKVSVEVALQYTDSYTKSIFSFANDIKTIEGGTHLTGFKAALTKVMNEYALKNRLIKNTSFSGDDVLEGLTAVISVKVPEPQFEGQTKTKLGNSEVKGIVQKLTYDYLKTYLDEHPSEARAIIAKITKTMEARKAAQKAKELIRRKNVLESSVLPGKLADCIEKDPEKCELFIVEGDSAGGSAKQGRDRRYQAILPLKGKILNVEKAAITKTLSNDEIKSIVMALGGGFGEDFDVNKVRYHKIIIMTDADVDGSHIKTLLLTLFYRYFKPIIEKGYLYVARPPLYKIKKGKTIKYAYSDEELEKIRKELGDITVQRYKGLGEMNPQQLWETTMDPEKRSLIKITIEDAIKADEIFSLLMGDAVEPRKEFIVKYAREVKNLDI